MVHFFGLASGNRAIIGVDMARHGFPSGSGPTYRQAAMPWAYWLALVLFGALTILIVLSTVSSWLTGGRPSVIAAVLFLVVLGTLIWFYGPRRAFEVALDGGEVVWRAPMLTRRVPIDRIDGISTSKSPFTAAEPCLVLDDGSRLVVAVSGRQQSQDFHELVCELTSQRPNLQVTYSIP